MTIKDSLKDLGIYVSDIPVKKSVTWKAGKKTHTFDVYVKASSAADIELRMTGDGAKVATTIAQSIVDENGAAVFSYDEAARLKPTFSAAILKAIQSVNADAETAASGN